MVPAVCPIPAGRRWSCDRAQPQGTPGAAGRGAGSDRRGAFPGPASLTGPAESWGFAQRWAHLCLLRLLPDLSSLKVTVQGWRPGTVPSLPPTRAELSSGGAGADPAEVSLLGSVPGAPGASSPAHLALFPPCVQRNPLSLKGLSSAP